VPLGALLVWGLVVKGTYQSVEKVFLAASVFYVAYVISAILVEPDWGAAMSSSVRPVLLADRSYIAVLVGLVGTSVAPWMQFYLQAAIVEKGIDSTQYRDTRIEVIAGCVMMAAVAFFIIVACAGAIWEDGPRPIASAAEAAEALKPLGAYAYALFAGGLLCASLFAASILPLSTAYTVCEGLGLESGVDHDFDEAPSFYWMYTLLIVLGAGVVLIPDFPIVPMILLSQVLNGVLLPVVMVIILKLVNRKDLMHEWTNGPFYNFIAGAAVVLLTGLAVALAGFSIFPGASVASGPALP
jgi:Mn2+/Fe2+ NRAMP family transporter